MWIVIGIFTIALQPGILQIVEKQEFSNPQDCFDKAMEIMADTTDPRGMACVPIKKDSM